MTQRDVILKIASKAREGRAVKVNAEIRKDAYLEEITSLCILGLASGEPSGDNVASKFAEWTMKQAWRPAFGIDGGDEGEKSARRRGGGESSSHKERKGRKGGEEECGRMAERKRES